MDAARRDPRYRPYAEAPPGPFRWRLGLRPLDLAEWIEVGEHYERDMAAKRDVRQRHPDTVFAALAEADVACAEVLDLLVDHLIAHWPGDFVRDGDSVVNRRLGERIVLEDGHPLDVAGRLVQEDLVVMVELAGELVFAAGSVCFPNRWDLRSKIGLPLDAVHAPVSRLNEQLGGAITRFFERLTPQRSFWRLGWGVIDTDDLFQPLDGTARPRPTGIAAEDVVVRVERETVRRLPGTGGILFTIRTYNRRVGALTDAEERRRLVEQIAGIPDDVAEYKQLGQLRPLLAPTSRPLLAPARA